MWQLIRRMLLDQRGEDGIDTGGAPVETGEAAPVDNNGLGTDSGQAGEAPEVPAEPRFGEFGDNPEEAAAKLFEAYQRTQGEYNNFKTKAGLTEKNLGTLRKTLESSGIRAVEENSNILAYAFPAETLLYSVPLVTVHTDYSSGYKYAYTYRHTVNPYTWNRYYHPANDAWEYVYINGNPVFLYPPLW